MTTFTATQQYESSSEDDPTEMNEPLIETKSRIRRKFDWVEEKSFSNDAEAQMAVKEEGIWSRYYTNKRVDGISVYYRCNQVKFRGRQCDASIYLYYPHDIDIVTLFCSKSEHNHTNASKHFFLSEKVKENIQELFNLKLKPKKIYELLQEKNFQVTRNQVNNYLVQLRKQKYGPSTLSLGELESWCQRKSNVPQGENEAFVVSFHIHYEDESDNDDEDAVDDGNKFRFFLSTKSLLKISSISKNLHADATYKLIWQGFPVLVIGTSDYDRKFHPFGLAVCSDEKQTDFEFIFKSVSSGVERIVGSNYKPEVLIADGSGAIRKAFSKLFNDNKMVMCWPHAQRNIEKKIKGANKKQILDDIDHLQLCESESVFQTASSLFLKKWRQVEEEFIGYFEYEWLELRSSWYEGYSHPTPSTNNALEATNKIIKDEHTLRERLPLARFLTVAETIVNSWSSARNQNQTDPIIFSTEPTITLGKWTKSYHFAKSSKTVLQISSKRKNVTDYYVPASTKQTLSKTEIQKYNRKKWTSFDQFKDIQFGMWKFTLPNDGSEWKSGFCNCPNFFKEYICKHIIGMAIRLKFCKPPPAAKDIPIGEKRKRGRPRKTTKALLID